MAEYDKYRIGAQVLDLLLEKDISNSAVTETIESMQKKYGDIIYFYVFKTLTDKRFPPKVAARHWKSIKAHRLRLKKSLRRDVGIQVAMMDYCKNIGDLIENPMFMELASFEREEERALVDPLTGVYHRKIFPSVLERELRRAQRFNYSLSLIFFDIDYFKKYNDYMGHSQGDVALQKVVKIIAENVREFDNVFRYGGEEFIAICPQAKKTDALSIAERIRTKVALTKFKGQQYMPKAKLTVSAGIACYPEDTTKPDKLVEFADIALYEAKHAHRNTVRIYFRKQSVFKRLKNTIQIKLQPVKESFSPHQTNDVQQKYEKCILMSQNKTMPVGKLYELLITNNSKKQMKMVGRVVLCEYVKWAKYDIGILLYGLTKKQLTFINRVVK